MNQVLLGAGAITALGLWVGAIAARRNRRAAAAAARSDETSTTTAAGPMVAAYTPTASSTSNVISHAPTAVVSAAASSSTASAGDVAARTDESVSSPSSVVANLASSIATGAIAAVSSLADAVAGGVAARADESVSQVTADANVSAAQDLQPDTGELAETAVEHALPAERRIKPIASRYPSDCPGWLGAVLNYGALVQTFFTHYLDKHGHMSFDFDVVHTDNYSSIIYDEPTEYEVRTAPDSVPKLWFHTWKEPPPPCAGLISDKFVNWKRDLRGSVAARGWEGDRGIWFDWDCWSMWKCWPVIVCLNHPEASLLKMMESWGNHWSSINWKDNWARKPADILAEFAGKRQVGGSDQHWLKVQDKLKPEIAYLPIIPNLADASKTITANRDLAAIPSENVANKSWPNPDVVRHLYKYPIALFAANWNERLILGTDGEAAKGRWKDRFVLKDIRPLLNDGTLPYTWETTAAEGDWLEQIKQLNNAYNYLLHGRWIVWATLMYALAYHRGDPARLPGWWVNYCSTWAIPVPRADRKAKSVSVEGGLKIKKANVPARYHGSYELEHLLEACRAACPMPGSEPVSAMQRDRILSWHGVATGQYRPPVRWVRGWWSYRISKEDIGTNWADILQGAVLSIAASAASSAVGSVLDVATDAIDVALDELPEVVGAAFSEFVSQISSRLVTFAGNLVKGYVEDFDLQSVLMPAFEVISQYGSETFGQVAEQLFAGSSLAGDEKAIYEQMRGRLEDELGRANENWGYLEDLFGTQSEIDSMLYGDIGTTDVLYQAAQKFGRGQLY